MSKTAEEILRQELNITAVKHGEDPVLNEDWDEWKDEQGPQFMNAMWDSYTKFAAQEVDAYKDRLRTAIMYADDDGSSRYREGMNSVLDLIDTVK